MLDGADAPLGKIAQGTGVAPYVELVGTKSLTDMGHSVLRFSDQTFEATDGVKFDIDSLTTFDGRTYANQAKALFPDDPATATTLAIRMNDWINVEPGKRVGQYIFPEANPNLLPRSVYDAIKAVNPDIRIIDMNGNTIPRP